MVAEALSLTAPAPPRLRPGAGEVALCEWGWTTRDVHRIEWWAMAGNTGSRAVAEKFGFTVEGTLRNRGIANDGKPHGWWVGGLLRT